MPVGFDPGDTCLVTLDCVDAGRPEETRVRFRCRYLSARDEKAIARLRATAFSPHPAVNPDEAPKPKSDDEVRAGLIQAIEYGITGWENLVVDSRPVPFGADGWEEFTFRQIEQISREYPSAVYLAERDRKNFGSPSPTPTGKPPEVPAAATAENPAAASAPVAPPSPNPSTSATDAAKPAVATTPAA